MGADLYIESLNDACQKENKPHFDKWVKFRDEATDPKIKEDAQRLVSHYYERMYEKGYFRDSYNGSNMLNRLGLSWWTDFAKFLNDDGHLTVEKARELLAIIEKKKIKPVTKKWLIEHHCTVDDGENSVDSWNKDYAKRKAEFESFLKTAIDLNEPIRCSI